MDFMAEKVYFSGPDRPSTIKNSILMEGQIFDFWGDFTGKPLRTLLEHFLNNLDFSLKVSTKTLLPPYFNHFVSTNKGFLCNINVVLMELTRGFVSGHSMGPNPKTQVGSLNSRVGYS